MISTSTNERVWEKEFDFDLYDAVVAKDGSVGGYAYSIGLVGSGRLRVIIIDPSGSVLQDHSIKRASRRVSHSISYPHVIDIVIHRSENKFIVRIAGSAIGWAAEWWWLYDLRNGESLGAINPLSRLPKILSRGRKERIHAIEPLEGTPLVVITWGVKPRAQVDQDGRVVGSLLTVMDSDGSTIWYRDGFASNRSYCVVPEAILGTFNVMLSGEKTELLTCVEIKKSGGILWRVESDSKHGSRKRL